MSSASNISSSRGRVGENEAALCASMCQAGTVGTVGQIEQTIMWGGVTRWLGGKLVVHGIVQVLTVLTVLPGQSLLNGTGRGESWATSMTIPDERRQKD